METNYTQNNFTISVDEYPNIDTQKIYRIILKDGNILEINNNLNNEKYEIESLNKNSVFSNSSFSHSDMAKVRKFNSYSEKIQNNSNESRGFYVSPIPNKPKKLIQVKVPDYETNLTQKNNHHIQSFTFKSSPRKYNYKPYKPPKRKHNLIIVNSKYTQGQNYTNGYYYEK